VMERCKTLAKREGAGGGDIDVDRLEIGGFAGVAKLLTLFALGQCAWA